MDAAALRHLRLTSLRLLLVLTSGCATLSASQTEQPEVVDLSIQGTEQVSESDIKKRIVTSEPPWWAPLWPFEDPHLFDPNTWQADLRRIERYYQAQGYYEAEVVSSEVKPRPEGVALEVTVQEGPPTHVGSLTVRGLEALPEEHRERVLTELPLEQGALFREADWDGVKDVLRQRLHELGYAEAEVEGEVRVDLPSHRAEVDLQVSPGPRYRFGNIFVATDADPKVSPRRIIEQAQGAVHKGDWFSESALAEAQARIFRMGVFGAVKVNRGAPDRETGTVPVVVDVREAPFRSIRLGGGVGVDAARHEVRALAEWTHRNFLGGLRRLTLSGRAGYAFIPDTLSVLSGDEGAKSGPIFRLAGQFEQPRFIIRDLRLQTSLTAERGLEQAYEFIGGRFRGGVVWQPHPDFSAFPSYNLEVYRLAGQQTLADGETPTLTFGCRARDSSQPCNIALSFLEHIFEWDRRDDPIAPRSGYYLGLSLQGGGGPLQGDFTYVRLLPDLRYYQSFGPDQHLTFAAKLRLGTLIPFLGRTGTRESPIVNRFFSGGGSSMRGFNSRRLSPMIAVRNQQGALTQEIVPIGGNGLFESSLEMRYRLFGDLALAAFYDTGLVGQDSLHLGDRVAESGEVSGGLFGSRHYQAVGLGLRYHTVVGPIRLDIARRLDIGAPLLVEPTAYEFPEPAGCFGFGGGSQRKYAGAPEGVCTFHLSIGEAF